LVLGWVVAIHQLEANVLNPKILGDSARVHPVLVVFALLTGEHFYGVFGALLAVPVLSITQTVFLHLRERFLAIPRNSSFPPPPAHDSQYSEWAARTAAGVQTGELGGVGEASDLGRAADATLVEPLRK
jgi:hypothetical protein